MVPFEFEEFEKFEDDSVFDDAVKRGSYILAYSKTVVKKVCEKASSRKLNGKHVMVVNSPHWRSEIGSYAYSTKLTNTSSRSYSTNR